MKILKTMVAVLAISGAVNAQQSECSFRTDQGITARTYDGSVRTVFTGDGINIVNRSTGEVLDFIEITESSFGVRCRPLRSTSTSNINSGSSTSSGSTGSTTVSTTVSQTSSSSSSTSPISSSSNSSGTRRGFPASAALGLP